MIGRALLLAMVCSMPAAAATTPELDEAALLESAGAGEIEAMQRLCHGYLTGQGIERKPAQAFRWCSTGARRGNPNALALLGEMYRFGTHVPKSDRLAQHFYYLAAMDGHNHARYRLGLMALTEPEFHSPYDTCYWLKQAADGGYPQAREVLDSVETRWRAHDPDASGSFCDHALRTIPAPS